MEIKRIKSFEIDHTILDPGFYISRVDGDITTFDLRTRKPNTDSLISPSCMHTLEHMFATFVRNSSIAEDVVYFGPMGCQTGFYLSTMQNVEAEDVRMALAKVYKEVFPLKSADDVVGLNEIQCGNPGLYAIDSTNAAMAEYMRTLFTADEAQALGIGSVYEKWW